LRNGLRQDGLKLHEISELVPNVRQMCARDPVHVSTWRAPWPSQGKHGANFLESEPEVAGSPDESQYPRFGRSVDSPVCAENLIRVDDVMESPKLAE
jgi:hypothetical protein